MRTTSQTFVRGLLALVLLAGVSGPVRGQEGPPVAAAEDVESANAIIAAVYDVISGPAGAERDWDRMRSLFFPGAQLTPSFESPDGGYGVQYMSVEDWIVGAKAWFSENAFFEVEIHQVAESYGHIAHAFSTYESRREADGEPFTRGINSFQLMFDGTRWWIVNIFWQGETESEPIPGHYLP